MFFFTSNREKHLWIWALVVIIAIYASLSLAGALAEALRNRNMLDNAFFGGFILVLVAIIWSGLKRQARWYEIWVGIGVLAVYGLVLMRLFISPEERTHLVEYGIVGILIYQALRERRHNGRNVPVPALLAVLLTGMLGWIDEGIQALLPHRVYDIRDVGFNVLAGLMAVAASTLLAWIRHRKDRGWTNATK